jgi:anti-sigma regulatory factor (Ser/Thr protein kinase)
VTAPLRLSVRRSDVPAAGSVLGAVRIAVRLPSRLDVLEEAVEVVARHCLAEGLSARRARFHLRVALCEALANAILYGNGEDPTKSVDVTVTVTPAAFAVEVVDEGCGFDPTCLVAPVLPDDIEAAGGRGLFLIRQLVDDVTFNDRGNAICMVLRRA